MMTLQMNPLFVVKQRPPLNGEERDVNALPLP
jgi:hypothetical protein